MNIKFLRGKESALPASYVEGTVYFCTDTGNLFFDTSNSRIQVSETYINNLINNVNTRIDNLTATATTTSAGLMSAADKSKLDGIAAGANNYTYTLPTATSSVLGGVKVGSNISVSSGVISVPTANGTKAGVTIVYPAASCTTFSSDSGTVTPLAVQKGAKMFSITRPQKKDTPESTTDKAITRWQGMNGDVQNSTIIIEDVTNSRDNSAAQVIAIPASGGKKMVYGYCTDQVDGTSFIGGIFDADVTEYPYNKGLAIGGTSGNLLWKGNVVVTAENISTYANKYTLPAATASALGGVKIGSNITNSSGTISLTKANVTSALGYTPPASDTTYSAATQSVAGLMSAADKTKLDGIATGANNYTYTLPAATSSVLGGVKIGSNITVSSGTISLTKANVTSALGYTPPTSDTNTHYTTRIYAGASGTAANAAATSPYIKITDDNTYRNQIRLVGSGATTVTSDASGNITISSTDNNTTYTLSSITGTLAVNKGGSGKTSWTANQLIYPSASTTMAQLAFPSVAGSVLRQGTSGAPYWTSLADLATAMGAAKIEVVSYAGTDGVGSDGPCSITFSFAPKVIIMLGWVNSNGWTASSTKTSGYNNMLATSILTTSYVKYRGFWHQRSSGESTYGKKSADGKTIYWYETGSAFAQCNDADATYYVLGVG